MGYSEQRERASPEETLDLIETSLYRALSEAEEPEATYEIRTSLQRLDVLRRRHKETAHRAN